MKKLIQAILKTSSLFFLIAIIFSSGCQQQKPDASEELKPLADKFVEVWNNGNYDELDAIFDPGFVRIVNQIPGMKKVMSGFRTAFPDLLLTIDNAIYAENSAAIRWAFSGTNTGPGEMPSTGKSVSAWGISILHFANGKLTEEIVAYDNQSFMEQLGFVLVPPSIEE